VRKAVDTVGGGIRSAVGDTQATVNFPYPRYVLRGLLKTPGSHTPCACGGLLEKVVVSSHTTERGNLDPTTLSRLEIVTGEVNSLLEQGGRSKQDLYLLIDPPGSTVTQCRCQLSLTVS
jgi:hypothetical protein